jgi:hypothetical protein
VPIKIRKARQVRHSGEFPDFIFNNFEPVFRF